MLKIIIHINNLITPNLLRIVHKIEYANIKYYSGLLCSGVFIGFAGMKLSESPRKLGIYIIIRK